MIDCVRNALTPAARRTQSFTTYVANFLLVLYNNKSRGTSNNIFICDLSATHFHFVLFSSWISMFCTKKPHIFCILCATLRERKVSMKTDIRSKYTQKVIRDNFIELLKETPLNKISVKAICEKADINRTTFYRYYKDPFDLMDRIEDDLLAAFRSHIKETKHIDVQSALEAMFAAISHNQELCQILISDNGDRFYIHKMITNTYDIFKDNFARNYPTLTDNQRRWLYYYIAQGGISITIDWLNGGMRESPTEMAGFIAELNLTNLNHKFEPI